MFNSVATRHLPRKSIPDICVVNVHKENCKHVCTPYIIMYKCYTVMFMCTTISLYENVVQIIILFGNRFTT